jgi:hypothetical protein
MKVYTTAPLEDVADAVSLTHNRAPDPGQWKGVFSDLRT